MSENTGETGQRAGDGAPPRGRPAQRVLPLLVDVAVPTGAYYVLHSLGANDFAALTAGGVASGLLAVAGIIRNRRIDGFAVFILALFSVGMLTTLLTGDVRFLLAKESFGTGVAGLVLLATTPMHRPLTFYTGRRFVCGGDRQREQWWERMHETRPAFRRVIRNMGFLWGLGLLTEAAVRVVLAYTLPVPTVVALSNVLQIAVFAALIAVSSLYGRRARTLARTAATTS